MTTDQKSYYHGPEWETFPATVGPMYEAQPIEWCEDVSPSIEAGQRRGLRGALVRLLGLIRARAEKMFAPVPSLPLGHDR